MKISRQVGTIGELVPIFIQDATVSTGFGLPNVTISTISAYWFRSDMTGASNVPMVSTGTLGTYSSGQFLQINSTQMRGWYQFCPPNAVFAAGSTCALHIFNNLQMAPVPMEIELTRFNNQGWVSSQPHNVTRVYSDVLVTSASGYFAVERVGVSSFNTPVGVSAFALRVGVSSFNSAVGVSSFDLPVGVSSMAIGVGVTTFSSPVGVSSFDLPVGVSAFALRVGVSSFALPVGVSSIAIPVGVSSLTVGVNVTSVYNTVAVTSVAGYFPTHFDLELTRNVNSTVTFSSVSWSSQAVTVGAVDVTSFSGTAVVLTEGKLTVDVSTAFGSRLVTSAAGVLGSHVTSMRAAIDRQIADALLGRNIAGGADGGRTVTEAVYLLRNRSEIAGGELVVYGTDDATSSWSANVTTTAGNPISQIDPA